MADEQNEWLDRETAELLLCGESLEAVHPGARERAERLAAALDTLSTLPGPPTSPAPSGPELPGESAALAAFRKVNGERADASAGTPAALGRGTARRFREAGLAGPAGLVRHGPRDGSRRSRGYRPLRLGLAAALAVGMVGSVAVAAGTGMLPTPFGGTGPEPGATVSAAASPERPLLSPSPRDGAQGGPSSPAGTAPGTPDGGNGRDNGAAGNRDADDGAAGGGEGHRSDLVESCRRVGAGKEVDGAHARALTRAAGGARRVGEYCGHLLATHDPAARDRDTGGRRGGGTGGSGPALLEGGPRWDTGADGGRGDGDKNGGHGKGGKGDQGQGRGNDDRGEGGQGKDGKQGHHAGGQGDRDGGDDGPGDDDSHLAPPVRHPHHPRHSHDPHQPHDSRDAHPQPPYASHTTDPIDTA